MCFEARSRIFFFFIFLMNNSNVYIQPSLTIMSLEIIHALLQMINTIIANHLEMAVNPLFVFLVNRSQQNRLKKRKKNSLIHEYRRSS